MTSHLLFGFIKILLVSVPFLSMVMMILALWGVLGKTIYTDIHTTNQDKVFAAKEAKNYLVNETKTIEQCPEQLKSPDIGSEGENPISNKIDWEHVV